MNGGQPTSNWLNTNKSRLFIVFRVVSLWSSKKQKRIYYGVYFSRTISEGESRGESNIFITYVSHHNKTADEFGLEPNTRTNILIGQQVSIDVLYTVEFQ